MRLSFMLFVGLAGCQMQPAESATSGAPPGVGVPVGPLPGPGAAAEPHNPFAGDIVAATQGRSWFKRYNCDGCHGGHAGGGMGPSLRDDTWVYGKSDARIFESIAQGRGKGMPGWGAKVPADQIWQLVTYVEALRTPNEPEPPR